MCEKILICKHVHLWWIVAVQTLLPLSSLQLLDQFQNIPALHHPRAHLRCSFGEDVIIFLHRSPQRFLQAAAVQTFVLFSADTAGETRSRMLILNTRNWVYLVKCLYLPLRGTTHWSPSACLICRIHVVRRAEHTLEKTDPAGRWQHEALGRSPFTVNPSWLMFQTPKMVVALLIHTGLFCCLKLTVWILNSKEKYSYYITRTYI